MRLTSELPDSKFFYFYALHSKSVYTCVLTTIHSLINCRVI